MIPHNTCYYLGIELCGPTLVDVVRSLEELDLNSDVTSLLMRVEWLVGLSKGLKELHDYECVHGDYKSSNIVMRESPSVSTYMVKQATMIDFGHSGLANPTKSREGGTVGYRPYEYSPSEQFDEELFTMNMDVFSLGIVFIELLFAQPIHEMIEFDEYVEGHTPRHQLENLLIDVPKTLRKLLENMLHWDHQKIPNIDFVVEQLETMHKILQGKSYKLVARD